MLGLTAGRSDLLMAKSHESRRRVLKTWSFEIAAKHATVLLVIKTSLNFWETGTRSFVASLTVLLKLLGPSVLKNQNFGNQNSRMSFHLNNA